VKEKPWGETNGRKETNSNKKRPDIIKKSIQRILPDRGGKSKTGKKNCYQASKKKQKKTAVGERDHGCRKSQTWGGGTRLITKKISVRGTRNQDQKNPAGQTKSNLLVEIHAEGKERISEELQGGNRHTPYLEAGGVKGSEKWYGVSVCGVKSQGKKKGFQTALRQNWKRT